MTAKWISGAKTFRRLDIVFSIKKCTLSQVKKNKMSFKLLISMVELSFSADDNVSTVVLKIEHSICEVSGNCAV